MVHDAGALLVVDGAQARAEAGAGHGRARRRLLRAHLAQDVRARPGVGVLFGRRELLEEMPPFIGGGSMIHKVGREDITWATLPAKFEGGTPAIAEAIGFGDRRALARRARARGRPRRRGRADHLRARAPGRGARPARLRPARRRRPRRHRLVRARGRPRPRRLRDPRPPRASRFAPATTAPSP